MNDQTPSPTPTGQSAATPTPHGNALSRLFARATLTQLTLAVLVVVFIWQWLDAHRQLNLTQQEVARRLSEVEAANKANQMLVAQNQELVRELGGKLGLLESRYAETQNQRAALENLYREMSSSRDQTALAEVEQMLLIAGQQLQLTANVKAALIALQQAEARLQQLNRPAFANLKQRISHDIERLRALPSIDATGISQKLDELIVAIDTLPLAQDAHVVTAKAESAEGAEDGWLKRFWREFWLEVKQLVRIENTEQEALPLLSPTQTFFLRENLKLRLQVARMALLGRDEASFRREMKTAQEWLKRYFDTRSDAGAQALATLQKLAASRIAIEMPDIGGSLEAVRNYHASHERGVR
jgi:uroporphyrin-3 C-methyltransferase